MSGTSPIPMADYGPRGSSWNRNAMDARLQRRPMPKSKTDAVRGNGRRKAHKRLPVDERQQLLDAISAGGPFRATVKDLDLTSHQVWDLTKTDQRWAAALGAALMASRRDDLKHGTSATYVQGCVCSDCRAHQRIRMHRREQGELASLSEPVQWSPPRSPRSWNQGRL